MKKFLRENFSGPYKLAQRIYYALRHLLETYVLGTELQEWIWKRRHIAAAYTVSVNHPHRKLLIEVISASAPFDKVLEVGCASGPNLYLLAKKFPNSEIYGIDINQEAIEYGQKWLAENNVENVQLAFGKADGLGKFEDKSFDVVFTDAVLMYIGPDKIKRVLHEFFRLARKTVILLEWHQPEARYYDGHWIYDYELLIKNLAPQTEIKFYKIPRGLWDENWTNFGRIIEIKLLTDVGNDLKSLT